MAQLSKSGFLSKWLAGFATNGNREITAVRMQEFRQDLTDSFVNKLDDVYWTQTVVASGTDSYTATANPAITSLSAVQRFYIKFENANTGAATLDISGLGAKSILKKGGTALEAGDISDNQIVLLAYDGTNFQMIGGVGSGGSGGPAIADNYADIAALIAAQGDQEENALYYVADASDDTTVDSGWAVYRYLGTTDGDIDDYQKLSEEESLDVIFNVLGTALTGYTSGSNAAIAATDTVLQAFGKTQGQLNAKLNTGDNTGLAGTGLRFVYANADGQIVRNGNVSYNTTTGEMRIDALSSIADDFSLSIYNDDEEMIMRVSNGKYVEYGGTSSFWEVQSGISDGNAGIIFLPSQDVAYRLKDTGSFDYAICKSSTNGIGRAFIIKQKQVNDHGVGFQTVRRQFKLTLPNTTAGAAHVVGSIPIPSGSGISVHVLRAWAYATNGNMISCEPFAAIGNNTGGTTSGTSTTPTAIRVTATTGGFSVVWNDTDDRADIVFTNETGTGRQYDVQVDIEYILSQIPV